MKYSNKTSPRLWIVRWECNSHLYAHTFQNSPWISSKWKGPHKRNAMDLLLHLVRWKRTNYKAAKFIFPQNQVNLAQSSFSKAHWKEPSGAMRNGHALTHQHTMPSPSSALDHGGWTQCNWQGDVSVWSSQMDTSISTSGRRQLELTYVFLSFGKVIMIM